MTFFLKDGGNLGPVKAPVQNIGPTSFLQGLGAAFGKAALENDANFRYLKERERETERMAAEAAAQIGTADLVAEGRKRGVAYLSEETLPLALKDLRAQQMILDVARERAQADPTAWQGMDLTDEGMQKRIDARLQSEYRDQQQTLDMMGWGRGVAEFVGGMAGITADIKNAPFLFFGGGSGSVLKVMGREAAINVAAEAAFLPSQFQMAERLNIPDPDVSTQLLMAAGAGAAIGGAVEGFGRAWTYWKGRNQTPAMEGFEAFDMEAAIDAAEEAMLADENPLEAVERAMQGRGTLAEEVTPEPTPLAPSTVYGDDARNDINLTLQEMLDDAVALGARGNIGGLSVIPTDIEYLKAGAAAFLDGRSEAPTLGSRQASALAEIGYYKARQQVQSLGYEPVSTGPIERPPLIPDEVIAPAVPAAEGRRYGDDARNDVRITLGEIFDEALAQGARGNVIGVAVSRIDLASAEAGANAFLDGEPAPPKMSYREGQILADFGFNKAKQQVESLGYKPVEAPAVVAPAPPATLKQTIKGRPKGQRVYAQADMAAAMDAEAYRAARLDEERPNTATADYLAMQPAPRGLFIDLEKGDGFLTEAELASKVNGWIDESEFATILTPSERAEIIATVQARGGDVEYLVERVLEREADYVEAPDGAADQAAGSTRGADGRGDVPFGPVAGETGSSGAGQGGRGGADPAQLPGFDRIQTGDAQRNAATVAALQQQSKIRRLDQTRVEDDAGGLFGGARRDMFDDPGAKAARPLQDQMAADLRDFALQNGDPKLDPGDGKGPRSVTAILADLDADDAFSARIDLCGMAPGKAP